MALAKWYKIDFHTHSPESRCFKDKSVTPEKWIEAAKKSGLNAVVVTDHNSVGYIKKLDRIKSQYEDKEFKIFYGIELCVSADLTHILVIFDDSLTVQQIEDAVVADLKLKKENWTDTEKYVTETELQHLCNQMRDKIFVIPAHFASNKGLGTSNINAIKRYQDFLEFDAVEVRTNEDEREYTNKLKNGYINRTVTITGSDNPSDEDEAVHSIGGFGKKFTWMKMSELSFEGIRQAFIDPENRCINYLQLEKIGIDFNPNAISYNYVSGVTLSGFKHLSNDMDMRFSPNLNCIVGSRGSGKSTIVEAIHYGLNDALALSKCALLSKTMRKDGQIDTYFEFGDSKPYKITAKKKGKELEYTYLDDDGEVSEPPKFKIDFYGQKEIFSIIEDENNISDSNSSPLLTMIDEKIDTQIYKITDSIEDSISNMIKLSEQYRSNRRKIKELPTIRAEIGKAEAILQQFKASGIEEARLEYDKTAAIVNVCQKEMMAHTQYVRETEESLKAKIEDVENMIQSYTEEEASVVPFLLKIKQSYIAMQQELQRQHEESLQIQKEFDGSVICKKLAESKEKYEDALNEVRNAGSEDIQVIHERLKNIKEREHELHVIQETQNQLETDICEAIDVFINKREMLTQYRRAVIEKMDFNNISIDIEPLAHKTRWKQLLQKEFGKEGTYDDEFDSLVEEVLGDDKKEKYKHFLFFLLTSEDGNLMGEFGSYGTRFCQLWEARSKNDTLYSLIKVVPEDLISIKIIEGTTEIDINEGSPGQKSAAILAFILSSGDNPLIIDQPEDDLDNSLIYSLIVKAIRNMKQKRQIIIVTHNPNIPVLGDAEGIIVLERNADGKVAFRNGKKAGCIEEKTIRSGICEIMEGGEPAFKKREEKYLYTKK